VISELKNSHPNAPSIHFGVGCDHLLELIHSAGATVIGLDWRTSIADARTRLGKDTIVQGNLDPSLVQGDVKTALTGADEVLADNANHPGHIFNLGHGVTPGVNPDVLAAVVQHVHERTQV
jgi:uroporphyrinogen decarboxylase